MKTDNDLDTITHYCASPAAGTSTPWCFAGVLDRLDEGVLIADAQNCSLPYCNIVAGEILTKFGLELEFEALDQFLESKKISLNEINKQLQTTLFYNNRVMALNLTPLPDQSLFIQLKDVTEQKRLESIAQTVNTMDNLGFIFSGIRHEIGNPLNSIKMTNSVLQKNLDKFSREDISRYIDRTSSEISRMEYLLKSLKNFSMFEKVDCSPHNLNKFFSTLLGLIKPDMQQRQIEINYTPPGEDIFALIDPRALHQAILNILTNAADAMNSQTDPTINLSMKVIDGLVWVTISDNGCGMTDEQIKMLFQPFYTNKSHGNGLGLVITRKLLTMMQANLEIDSQVDSGTEVRIGLQATSNIDHSEHQTGNETQ